MPDESEIEEFHVKPRLLLGCLSLVLAAYAAGACISSPSTATGPVGAPYEGTALDLASPDFHLFDQNNQAVTLSGLRGKVLVLAFLDPHCTDICPLTAFHFKKASESLGDNSREVAFLAVNVNSNATSTEEMAAATRKWGVDGMPNWHYLTGSKEELEEVWRAYHIDAGGQKPDKHGEVRHTPGVYLIDRSGRQRRYISTAFDPEASLSELLVKQITPLIHDH